MIIDFHVHPTTPERLKATLPILERMKENEAIRWYTSLDLSAQGLLNEMRRGGVDKAVVLAVHCNVDLPLLNVTNEEVAALVKMHPDKFIGFASVCPTELIYGKSVLTKGSVEKAVEKLRRAVEDLGLRGLKLIQPFQHFYPNDTEVYPLYEEVRRLKIPILIHTGGEDPPGLIKYCNPLYLDDVAKSFPEIPIVAAHMGSYPHGVWFKEMMTVTEANRNMHVDLSALRSEELIGMKLLERAIEYLGSERILFGSDHPVVWDYPMSSATETVKNADISQNDKENILHLNAAKLLGIKS